MIAYGVRRISNHIHVLVRVRGRLARAAPQIIERRVMGDPKQPAFRVLDRSGAWQRFDRLHERVLHHILTVDDRAGHARAVAMQLRPQFGKGAVEIRAIRGRTRHWHTHSWLPCCAPNGRPGPLEISGNRPQPLDVSGQPKELPKIKIFHRFGSPSRFVLTSRDERAAGIGKPVQLAAKRPGEERICMQSKPYFHVAHSSQPRWPAALSSLGRWSRLEARTGAKTWRRRFALMPT